MDTYMTPKQIKKALTTPEEKPPSRPGVSSGCTRLNMALTGSPYRGFQAGSYYYFVGDSSSGKTWLALTCFAESRLSKHFKEYRLIHDNVEDGARMDLARYFGKAVDDAIEPPAGTRDNPQYSDSVESFYYNIDNAIKEDRPFIYVLDSMDSLDAQDDLDRFDKAKKAKEENKEGPGSYGVAKAKLNSTGLRRITGPQGLSKTGSILIIISQTRANLGFGHAGKTRSGGMALTFYATCELWTSITETRTKTVKGKSRPIGITTTIQLKKNRITGERFTKVDVPIYHSIGIDDVGGCVEYLIDEGYVSKGGKSGISIPELGVSGTMDKIIKDIETQGKEKALRSLVAKCYREIIEASAVKRKPRYQ